jgi:hypothetical protein
MFGFRGDQHYYLHLPRLGRFQFDIIGDRIVGIPDGSIEPPALHDAFQRLILPLVAQARGREVFHASAIRTGAGVVAFCAYSGVGKSTLAWGLSRRGFAQWADDVTVVEEADGAFRAVALPFSARLRHETVSAFDAGTGEPHTRPPRLRPDGVAPLAAICLLERQVVDGDAPAARLKRLPPARAFSAVLAHSESFEPHAPGRQQLMLEHYLELAAHVPMFKLVIASGLDRFPAVLDILTEWLGGLPSGPNPCAG